jgi:hypothetical protein
VSTGWATWRSAAASRTHDLSGHRYAGRLAGDPANTITLTETALINGTGTQVGNCGGGPCERWGDYSTMTLDPDGCTFWYTNEYYSDLSLNHKTRIGSFRYAGCTDSPPPGDTTPPVVSDPGLSPNPALPGATVTVTSTATDAVAVASAQKQLNGGSWTAMTAADGTFGETSEGVTSTIVAPATAGTYQVCVRATDSTGNTSNGTACSTLTVMSYTLAPAASMTVTQGVGRVHDQQPDQLPGGINLSVAGCLPAPRARSARTRPPVRPRC